MLATYYAIIDESDNSIVLDGIVAHPEDTIFPQYETGIEELPHECELHHFKAVGYKKEVWNFSVNRETLIKYRTTKVLS